MEGTYNGEMDPIVHLIKRFGGKAHLHKGRWLFGMPHIEKVYSIIFRSSLDPLESGEKQEDQGREGRKLDEDEKSTDATTEKTTMHHPHKLNSKRLRPYHVKTICELFVKAGYNLESVTFKSQRECSPNHTRQFKELK